MISPTFEGTKGAAAGVAEIEIFEEILTEEMEEGEEEEEEEETAAETAAETEFIRIREATVPLRLILRRLPTRHPG